MLSDSKRKNFHSFPALERQDLCLLQQQQWPGPVGQRKPCSGFSISHSLTSKKKEETKKGLEICAFLNPLKTVLLFVSNK